MAKKYREVDEMLKNPSSIDANDIANYALYNTTDNDNSKSLNIVNLIVAYTESVVEERSNNGN